MEVYKRNYDTKLLIAKNADKRFDILGSNKRRTPDQLGYGLKKIRLSPKGVNLDFLTVANKVEESLPVGKGTRLLVPKGTKDAVRF